VRLFIQPSINEEIDMNRILGLQKLNIDTTLPTNPVESDPGSSSSYGGCACSTSSVSHCSSFEEFVAV
jgi:hypothetical protein